MMRRNNGIPESTNVTNRQNLDGTFTRTTETLYNNGNEITTKETMTALEVQQLEDDPHYLPSTVGVAASSNSSTRRSLFGTSDLRPLLDDFEWDSPLFNARRARAMEGNSLVIICIKAMQEHFRENPSYFKSMIALSFVCLFTIIGLLKCIVDTGHHYDGCTCKGNGENLFTFISLLLSYVVVFMIYRAGLAYKEKSEKETSAATAKLEKDDWFLRWTSNLAWASFCVSAYFSYMLASSSRGNDSNPVHTDIQIALTMWNLMTATFMTARTEYLRRRSLNETLYIQIATAGKVGKSAFFWVVSLISGCLCGVCHILFDTDTRRSNELMYYPVSAMTLLYVISATVAVPWMMYRTFLRKRDERSAPTVHRNESEMLVVLIDETKSNETIKPISYLFVVSMLMYVIGILLSITLSQLIFGREHPIFEDYFGFVILLVVGWNSTSWVLMKRHICLSAEDIIKEQNMIKSCMFNCPQAKV